MDEKGTRKIDLFNNPMIDAALKALSPEQMEEYKQIGEYMFSTTKFDDVKPQSKSMEEKTTDGVFYIREALKAGLHPQDLEKNEIQLMYDIYGKEWYEEFGYSRDEVPEPAIKVDTTEGIPPEEVVEPVENRPMMTTKQLKNLAKKAKRKEFKKNNPGANFKKM